MSEPVPPEQEDPLQRRLEPLPADGANTQQPNAKPATETGIDQAAASGPLPGAPPRRESAEIPASILDALPAQIALLAADGTILAVNGAWRRFARQHGLQSDSSAVGANYLAVCDAAGNTGDRYAREAAAGIRSVLTGATVFFSSEYPCASPERTRWYRLTVTPRSEGDSGGAVVSHVDITETKDALHALQAHEESYRLVFNRNPQPMLVYDRKTLRFLAVNDAAIEQYGYPRAEFLALTLWDVQSDEGRDRLAALVSTLPTLQRNRGSWQHRKKNGEVFDVEASSEAILFEGQPARLVLAIDVSERRKAERAIHEREALFRATFEQAAVGMALVSPTGRFLKVNEKLCDMFGYAKEELEQMSYLEVTFAEDQGDGEKARQAMLAGTQVSWVTDKRYRAKAGHVVWTNLTSTIVRNDAGQPDYFISVIDDITQRKLAEVRLHRLNRLYAVLSKVAETIVRTRDRQKLYDVACQVMVEEGLLRMALIAEITAPGVPVKVVASHGATGSYVENLIVRLDEVPAGRGTIGTALRTGRHDVCNDIPHDPRMAPWQEAAHAHRFVSTASFPIKVEGETVSALVLFSEEPEYFQADEVALMLTVASDLSFALESLRREERRQEAEESIRVQARMLNLIAEGVIASDVTGKIIYANRHAVDLFGWPLGELIGRDVMDLAVPGSARGLPEGVLSLLQKGQSWSGEYLAKRKDGTLFPAALNAGPLLDKSGKLIGLIGVSSDITERSRSEDALRASEERFRLLAKATSDAIWDLDVATGKVWWSEGFKRLFGSGSPFEPTTEKWLQRVHPDDASRVEADFRRVIEGTETSWTAEYRMQRSDGSYAHVQDRSHVIRDASGRAIRAIGGVSDCTEQQTAARKLARQAALLDNARDTISVRDMNHRLVYWNKSAERVYGWTADEVTGRSVRDDLPRDKAEFDACMEKLLTKGAWNGELTQTTKDGRTIIVESRWTLMRDAAGQPESVLVINTDLTERKKLEQQFLRAQRMESLGTLAGGIAHDLNNLLAPILMGVNLLERQPLSEPDQRVVKTIGRSAARGTNLVKQVLSFARGVEGARVAVHLGHIIKEVESIVQMTFPKNVTMEAHAPAGLDLVMGDPTQLNQVVMNLCVNARDAMPNGGHLNVSVSTLEVDEQFAVMNREAKPGRYLLLEVTDTGSGIPKEILDRIFEPFFTTKDVGHGTGLGLSTVLGIVRSHGGFVKVYSELGKGTVFKVYLPADREGESQAASGLAVTELPRGNGELVLVVDDEHSILGITQQTLETYGYRTLVAEDGAQAIGLFALHRNEIAVVLTDMMMPVMDGLALIAGLRRIEPKVRIIAASGLNANATLAKATHAGIKHFLAKPYSAETMLKALHAELHDEP
jgi:PAS domain S-box-containing protein